MSPTGSSSSVEPLRVDDLDWSSCRRRATSSSLCQHVRALEGDGLGERQPLGRPRPHWRRR